MQLHKVFVFLAGYVIYGLSIGHYFSMGTLFPVIMETFNSTRAETASIQAIYGGIWLGGGILYGGLTSRFGPFKINIVGSLATSFGLIAAFWTTSLPFLMATSAVTAFGEGLCFVSCTVGVRQHFAGKAGVVALALISSSSGTIGTALTYLLRYLSERFGLKGTLLIIGGLQLNNVVLSVLLRKPLTRNNANKIGILIENEQSTFLSDTSIQVFNTCNTDTRDSTRLSLKSKLKHILHLPSYVCMLMGMVMCISTTLMYNVFILDMFVDKGFSDSEGAIGLVVLNSIAIVGRASPAAFAHCQFYDPFIIPVTATLLSSIAMVLYVVVNYLSVYFIASGFVGLGLGVTVSVVVVNISEVVEQQYLAVAIGIPMTINGVLALITGPLTGFIRDTSGSYTIPHIVSAVCTGIGSVMFVLASICNRRQVRLKKPR